MKKSTLYVLIMAVVVVAVLISVFVWGGNENATVGCEDCSGSGEVFDKETETMIPCEACYGTGHEVAECEKCEGKGSVDGVICDECEGFCITEVKSDTPFYGTWAALLGPIIAIALALVTKEVYSSLVIGILVGGLLATNFNIVHTVDSVIQDGVIEAIAGTAGIFAFLVILGVMVALINKSGGSAAFGRWAQKNIKTKIGASMATFILGVCIFIDDYFNCLTVGSVMMPVTDSKRISRPKLAYLIDATAAPVCMIAPISSWAAAVSSYAPEGQGISLFIKAIPYNLYSILTFVFIISVTFMKYDFGLMKKFEDKAEDGDLGALQNAATTEKANPRGKVIDMFLPVIVLVVVCVIALIYNGGFFEAEGEYYHDFVGSFSNTDATVGLPLGGFVALIFSIIYFVCRKIVTVKESMDAIPNGFNAMVPAILILTFATSLKNMTNLLGAKFFVSDLMANAGALEGFVPAIIFLVAIGISFATGTSWGTFGILIPIVLSIFPQGSELMIIGMSACLAGSVCGDHCSPISDTTIMSSAGAQCNHVDHVSTQLPYALTVAGIAFIGYLLLAVEALRHWFVILPITAVMVVGLIAVMKIATGKKAK